MPLPALRCFLMGSSTLGANGLIAVASIRRADCTWNHLFGYGLGPDRGVAGLTTLAGRGASRSYPWSAAM
jgi:hypothetical protein